MTRRRAATLAGLLIAAALAAAAPAGAQAPASTTTTAAPARGIGIRLLDGPSGADGDPRQQSYIVDRVARGARLARHVEVTNGSGEPVELSVYAVDADIRDGSFTGRARGSGGTLSAWTTVTPGTVRLGAGTSATATVAIAVPGDAEDGEHYGAVFVEKAGTRDREVQINSRVGIRVYLSVGTGKAPVSDFEVSALAAGRDSAGNATVHAVVRNTGARAIDLVGELRLEDGPGGVTAGPFAARVPTTLAPGDEEPVLITLDAGIPLGPWSAIVTLRSGDVEHRAQARITFPAPSARDASTGNVIARQVDPDRQRRRLAIPAAGIALASAAAAAFTVGAERLRVRRTRRRR